MKKSILFIAAFMLLSCRPNDNSDGCPEPAGSCNNCYRVYDDKDKFIFEGKYNGSIAWDGTDCKGNKVGCGKYKFVINYNGRSVSNSILVVDENTKSASGEESCDSLKESCIGTYSEQTGVSIGVPYELECICCQ